MVISISLQGRTRGLKRLRPRRALIPFMTGMSGSPWSAIGPMLTPGSLMKQERSWRSSIITPPSALIWVQRFSPGWKRIFQPGEKRWTEIKADGGVIIEDLQDLSFFIKDPGVSIGPIALQSDPLIPVMKGMSALLGLNDFKPRVLPWRLIEMTMNGYKCIFHLLSITDYLSFNALSYRTLPNSK